jgi:hypothetical protein
VCAKAEADRERRLKATPAAIEQEAKAGSGDGNRQALPATTGSKAAHRRM